jgi:hypothetical protein
MVLRTQINLPIHRCTETPLSKPYAVNQGVAKTAKGHCFNASMTTSGQSA